MNKVTREERAAKARKGTIAADPEVEIDAGVDLGATVVDRDARREPAAARTVRLAEAEFAHLPVYVVRSRSERRTRIWRSADGKWWRRGGTVRIQRWPELDGPRAFVVFLWAGANEGDLKFMLRQIARARRGAGFEREWGRVDASWADELTFACTLSRGYCDPFTWADDAGPVTVCDEALCVEKWHGEYGAHHLDEIERILPDGHGSYKISVQKELKDYDERGWTVDVYTDEFYGSPEDVAALVSDLQWMQEECRRANTPPPSDPSTSSTADDGQPVTPLDWSASPTVGVAA